jgi:hypothetical protein
MMMMTMMIIIIIIIIILKIGDDAEDCTNGVNGNKMDTNVLEHQKRDQESKV